jgi:YidC/Oxa1 family membrane protein insertase
MPAGAEDRIDDKTTAVKVADDRKDPKDLKKADVGVRITTRQVSLGPNRPVEHHYRVFTGPKTTVALKPYHAEELAVYRKNQWIPFAPWIAQSVITPTLGFTHQLTVWVSRRLGGTTGNYGVAIILLTILVRGLMFPIGRKQALAAQKMQQLQPYLKELQEKFKEDKERLTKETFALYKKHGVNPVAGCLPALIQLPIFVGLWQALNTSFPLRHASFLWIRDLAAPDMMFHFPFEIPFLGNWFNLLPFLVVGLMLVQTKLFAPPATTPEAEMQQKMMKYMMVFMGFMFYKVPSGLGIYFITSSLWAIGERLLLPKVTHAHLAPSAGAASADVGDDKGLDRRGPGGPNGDGSRHGRTTADGERTRAKSPGRIAQFFERLLEEARKDSTYRKMLEEREGSTQDDQRDKERPRPRPKPRKR